MPAGSYRDVIRDADVTSCPTVEVKSDGCLEMRSIYSSNMVKFIQICCIEAWRRVF